MKLEELSDSELSSLLQLFRCMAIADGNRYALDWMVIVEKECIRRHQQREMDDYSDGELGNSIQRLKSLVDGLREQGLSDSYPALRFLLLCMTAAITELERRQAGATTH